MTRGRFSGGLESSLSEKEHNMDKKASYNVVTDRNEMITNF